MPTTLTSNGAPVPFDSQHFAPLRDSSDAAEDPGELRKRYLDDGYLYLRTYLDPARSIGMRATYFSLFDPGYLSPGSSPAEGVFSGRLPEGLPAHGVEGHPAHTFVRGDDFERFASQPELGNLAEVVLAGPVQRLPRSIVRHFDRASRRASRAHTDFTYLDEGSDRLVTMWVPFGDCPLATGGLVYLEGSHRMDDSELAPLRAVTDRPGDARPLSHDLAWVAESTGRRWLWADYQAGDVAVHSPHMVHASLDTGTDAMRLSADIRFVREGDRVDPRWLKPWAGDDGN
ncbi:MAG TPA: phytanoyl-CoA dioxygenase family protein [Acidimicrobiales bacterium]|nr:phytanoyl-CoA dioxygenase family protein [Acidimicrobiales bacterium]